MDKVDEDMKKLFESVGYTSGENIDKETVDFIYDFVEKYGGIDVVKKEMAESKFHCLFSQLVVILNSSFCFSYYRNVLEIKY